MIIPLATIPGHSEGTIIYPNEWVMMWPTYLPKNGCLLFFSWSPCFFRCWSLKKRKTQCDMPSSARSKRIPHWSPKGSYPPACHSEFLSTPNISCKKHPRIDQNNLCHISGGDHQIQNTRQQPFFVIATHCHLQHVAGPSHSHCSIVCYEPQVLQQHEVNDRWDGLCSWLGHVTCFAMFGCVCKKGYMMYMLYMATSFDKYSHRQNYGKKKTFQFTGAACLW